MLTDNDIDKLERRFEKKFVTKDDLNVVEKQLIDLIIDLRNDMIAQFAQMNQKFDHTIFELKSVNIRHETRLENHEGRIQYLEGVNK